MAESTIKTIYSKSFTGQNLLSINLVYDSDTSKPYAPKYFAFVNMIPGTSGNGQRTYDMDRKVFMKLDVEKLYAIGEAVTKNANHAAISSEQNKAISYTTFTDPSKSSYGAGGSKKMISVGLYKKENEPLKISMAVKVGDSNPFGLSWSVNEAVAVGEMIKEIAMFGFRQDMMDKINFGGTSTFTSDKPSGGNKNNKQTSPSTSDEGFVDDGNFEDMPF